MIYIILDLNIKSKFIDIKKIIKSKSNFFFPRERRTGDSALSIKYLFALHILLL
jgi:hypothetical protein